MAGLYHNDAQGPSSSDLKGDHPRLHDLHGKLVHAAVMRPVTTDGSERVGERDFLPYGRRPKASAASSKEPPLQKKKKKTELQKAFAVQTNVLDQITLIKSEDLLRIGHDGKQKVVFEILYTAAFSLVATGFLWNLHNTSSSSSSSSSKDPILQWPISSFLSQRESFLFPACLSQLHS